MEGEGVAQKNSEAGKMEEEEVVVVVAAETDC